MRLFIALAITACSVNQETTSPDLSASGTPSSLCTTPACAASPCTPGCIFKDASKGCSGGSTPVDTALVTACGKWCGLEKWAVGCLRYRSEDPSCPTWCMKWGEASCWEQNPMTDYGSGGAICPSGYDCFGGAYPPEDASAGPCVDAAGLD